jgi:hypothetical protein
VTTRSEIEDNFGPPTWNLTAEKMIAYVWESTDPLAAHRTYADETPDHIRRTQGSRYVPHHVWSFCVAFDDAGHASRHVFLDAPDADKLREQISRWLSGAPK